MPLTLPEFPVKDESSAWGNNTIRRDLAQEYSLENYRQPLRKIYQIDKSAISQDYGEAVVYDPIQLPFEFIEEKLPDHEKIKKFIVGDFYKGRNDLNEVITPRIIELMEDLEDDPDEDQQHVNFLSFKNFIYFLINNDRVAIPSFVITEKGNVRALWRKSKQQHFAVEFHPDNEVTFVAFVPNIKNSSNTYRSSGKINQSILFDIANTLGANKWILMN